jgi:hypothetical protein
MVEAVPRPRFVLAVVTLVRSDRLLVFWVAPATVLLLEIMFSTLVVLARVGEVAEEFVPPRSPASSMRPGVVVVALFTVPLLVTVAQLVAVPLVACSTWPAVGVELGRLIPWSLATVGEGKLPDRSPARVVVGWMAVVAELRFVCTVLLTLMFRLLPRKYLWSSKAATFLYYG